MEILQTKPCCTEISNLQSSRRQTRDLKVSEVEKCQLAVFVEKTKVLNHEDVTIERKTRVQVGEMDGKAS